MSAIAKSGFVFQIRAYYFIKNFTKYALSFFSELLSQNQQLFFELQMPTQHPFLAQHAQDFKLRALALETVSAMAEMSARVFKVSARMWFGFIIISFLNSVLELQAVFSACFIRCYAVLSGSQVRRIIHM